MPEDRLKPMPMPREARKYRAHPTEILKSHLDCAGMRRCGQSYTSVNSDNLDKNWAFYYILNQSQSIRLKRWNSAYGLTGAKLVHSR